MDSYNIIKFVEAVLAVCEEREILIGEFENKIGVSRGYFSRVKAGKLNLKLTTAIAIANELDMYIDDLFFFDFDAHKIAQLKLKKEKLEEELEMLKEQIGNR